MKADSGDRALEGATSPRASFAAPAATCMSSAGAGLELAGQDTKAVVALGQPGAALPEAQVTSPPTSSTVKQAGRQEVAPLVLDPCSYLCSGMEDGIPGLDCLFPHVAH